MHGRLRRLLISLPHASHGCSADTPHPPATATVLQSPQQVEQLRAEFERCNGHKDCLDRLTLELGGQWKKGQISRQLKAMGLRKDRFTPGQVRPFFSFVSLLLGAGLGRGCAAPLRCEPPIRARQRLVTAHPTRPWLSLLLTPPLLESNTLKQCDNKTQEERMREWYEELRGRLDCFQAIAERLDAGFSDKRVWGPAYVFFCFA